MTDDEMRPKLKAMAQERFEQFVRLLAEIAPGRLPPHMQAPIWPPGYPAKPPSVTRPEVATVGEAPAWISRQELPGSSRPR